MKKILLLFVALLTLSVTAYAQDQERIQVFVDGDWAYYINPYAEHEVTVIQYQGVEDSEATELTIPSYATYNGSRYFVTELGYSLFHEFNNEGNDEYTHQWQHDTYTKLEKVTIPNTVTLINGNAFDGCTSLASVNIPNSVTMIWTRAFGGCTSLTSLTIPNSVKEIGETAFEGCTSLTSLTIPNSVTKIREAAFRGCESLQGIEVEEGNPKYTSVDGVLYNSDLTELQTYPGGKKGAFEIPNSVESIGWNAFDGCTSLTSVAIPNSVESIGRSAFYGCTGLTSVAIPNSVKSIGWNAFLGCTSLTSVTIPNSVTSISGYAFNDCTSLTSVTIPNSVKSIDGGAFEGCTSLTSVTIPNSVTEIGYSAFRDCTSLISVTIPNSVTVIDYDTFLGCTSLTSVTIPNSVTGIGWAAFSGCTSLTTIYALPATPPSCNDYSFRNVPETAVVYIPKGSFKAYFVADGWTRFTDFREMGALDITLSESTISIEEGKTATLTATVTKDKDVTVASDTWASSNPEVATVDNGVVTAVAEGTATITYTVVDGYGCPHTEYCEVTVSANTAIDDITVNGSDAPVEYYNLNGIRVNADHLTPGLYIKRQGGKATKVLVK